ncbi:MAG: ankyrin repeat domain-containing protein [Wolbachia endosymbiont of Xenopsylla cheopis]
MSLQKKFFSVVSGADIQKVARALLSLSLNINVQDSEGRTAILLATLHNNACIAKMLMVFGANPNIEDKYGMTAISMATMNNKKILEILQHTEEKGIEYPEQKVSVQEMFFHAVSFKQMKRVVSMLVNISTVKIDEKNKYGSTAVHLAVSNDDLYMLEILVAFRANLNAQDNQGNTALFAAILEGSLKMIKALLELGAKCNICNIRGNFPIHLAVERKHLTIIKKLCIEDTVNRNSFNGLAPLHLAIRHNSVNVVKELLLCDHIDINIRDNNGNTPLIMAGQNDCLEIARLLLEHGANSSLENHARQTFSDFVSSQRMECLAIATHLYKGVICQSFSLKRKRSTDGMDDETDKNLHRTKVESLEYTYQKPFGTQNTSSFSQSPLSVPGISLPKSAFCRPLSQCENSSSMSNISSTEPLFKKRCRSDAASPRSTNMSSPRSILSPYQCENSYNISDISLGGSSFRSDSLDMFGVSSSESSAPQSSYMSKCRRYFSTLDLEDPSEHDSPESSTVLSAKRARLR